MPPFELPNFEERYNSVMRFWLKWAIVTLPVVICGFVWIRSHTVEESLFRLGYHNESSLGVSGNRLHVIFMRASDWNCSGGSWHYQKHYDSSIWGPMLPDSVLGFGYQSEPGPGGASETIIELPMWAITLLSILPSVWLYRRHRKRNKIGFPIEPTPANDSMIQ